MVFVRFRFRTPLAALAAGAAALAISTSDATLTAQSVSRSSAGSLTIARAQAFVEAAARGLNYLPGEVIVRFKPGMAPDQQQRALMALRSRPDVNALEWHGEYAVLRDESQPNARILADQLAGQPEVLYAEPNYIAKVSPFPRVTDATRSRSAPRRVWITSAPNDADFFSYQWNMTLLRMPNAWDIQDGANAGIVVAVVDTGVTVVNRTYTFPVWTGSAFQQVQMPVAVNDDLPATRHVAPRDFVFPETNAVVDMDGHGSHVSGTIAEETGNAFQVAGMAYRARIMPVKVCTSYWELMIIRGEAGIPGFIPSNSGGCGFSEIADGIRHAANNGASVINISLGGGGTSNAIRDALAFAVSRGVFVAISMGNDFEDGNEVSFPARYAPEFEGVMSVAAIGKTERRAFYSSTGSHCEIAAPGGDGRVGGGADRGFIWQSTLFGPDSFPSVLTPRFDRYDISGFQGTSMASPHVAGLAALLMAQRPGITPADVERIIRATAKDLGTKGRDDEFGNGLIQPRAALFGRGIAR